MTKKYYAKIFFYRPTYPIYFRSLQETNNIFFLALATSSIRDKMQTGGGGWGKVGASKKKSMVRVVGMQHHPPLDKGLLLHRRRRGDLCVSWCTVERETLRGQRQSCTIHASFSRSHQGADTDNQVPTAPLALNANSQPPVY